MKRQSAIGSGARRLQRVCVLSLALVTATSVWAAPATAPTEKLAVPKSLDQIKPDQAMRVQYKEDFAARDPATRLALSHKLLQAADAPDLSAPTRWVYLREAREQAIDSGDLNAAFAVVDLMNDVFKVDARNMKVSAMSAALDKALIPPADLTATYLALVDQFLDDGDTDLAHNAAQLASDSARTAHDATLKTRVSEADKHIAAARREAAQITAAMRKLKTEPNDPDSSLLVGKYACFVRGLWSQGIPLLAEGTDSTLKALAVKELSNPDDAAAQAEIAGGWWNYAQTLNGSAATKTRAHAATWYQKAIPGLSGARKDEAAQRVGSINRQTSNP